jgi:hypothetical protein
MAGPGPTPPLQDGARIDPSDVAEALTKAPFVYGDGNTQTFTPDGRTVYTDGGTPTRGEWGVDDDGRFWSFWPPTFRSSYDLAWIVDGDDAAGVRFVARPGGQVSEGRYAPRTDAATA